MKRIICLLLLCVVLLTGCASRPFSSGISQNLTVPQATDTDPLCLTVSSAGTIANYYSIGTNSLEVNTMGASRRSETASFGKTFTIFGSSYPTYYSVTTRPAGELNELDVYTDRDGKITLNYVAGTDDLAVVTFSGTDVAPKVDGQINEATLTAAVLSVLPDDFNVDEWERIYDGSDYGSMLTYVKKIGEYQTIERVEAIFDFEGYVMEIRVYNYGQMAEVADKDVDMSALEAAVSGQIQKYYRKAAENPITSIKLTSAVMGKDVDGEVYYSVSADITYTNTTSAPASLQVIYFPDRV